jgi:hypothetical protein
MIIFLEYENRTDCFVGCLFGFFVKDKDQWIDDVFLYYVIGTFVKVSFEENYELVR